MKVRSAAVFTILLAAVLMCACLAAHAEWLYDGSPISIYGAAIGGGLQTDMVAQRFGFTVPVCVTELEVAVAKGVDPNNAGIRVSLAEDLYDLVGTTLASWTVQPIDGTNLAFVHLAIDPVELQPDRFYYLAFAPGDSECMAAVAFAYQGYPGLATKDDGSTWFDTKPYGVRVGGNVIPEPASIIPLAAGCLYLPVLLRRRQRRNGRHRQDA